MFSRHYTISNVMQPKTYNAYLKALKGQTTFDMDLLDSAPKDKMSFTIKNYYATQPNGMSNKICQPNTQHLFEIIGPIGKSLGHSSFGTHIAFCSGTGILPLIDFVAYVARKVLLVSTQTSGQFEHKLQLNSTEISADGPGFEPFRFILYASFESESEAIGLQLCESLHKFCVERSIPTFRLITRFSTGGRASFVVENRQPRWDGDFVKAQINAIDSKEIQKVWVCGPPSMSEVFDKAFSEILAQGDQRITAEKL